MPWRCLGVSCREEAKPKWKWKKGNRVLARRKGIRRTSLASSPISSRHQFQSTHCVREPQLVTVIMLNLLSRPSLPTFGGSSIGQLAAFRWSSTATQDTIAFLQQQRQQKSMCLLHSSIERSGIIWRNRDRILCVVLLADVQ